MKQSLGEEKLKRQPLLVPISLKVAAAEAEAVETHAEDLVELGFVVMRRGLDEVRISEVPLLLKNADAGALLRDVLSDLTSTASADRIEGSANEILATNRKSQPRRPTRKSSRS